MKLLTKEADYASQALALLAKKQGKFVSAATIAKAKNVPEYFLKRILQKLIKSGYLIAKEGAQGGVKLAKSPSKIKLFDIITLFKGDLHITNCIFRKKLCSNASTCILRKKMSEIEKKVSIELKSFSIAELIK